jgi:hypothetical protein
VWLIFEHDVNEEDVPILIEKVNKNYELLLERLYGREVLENHTLSQLSSIHRFFLGTGLK